MKQKKHVQYKAIFKQDDQTDTVQYQSVGIYKKEEKTSLSFHTDEYTIVISYHDSQIRLQHGQSTLNFDLEKEIWNQYQLPYGTVPLKTKVCLFEANDIHIKLKYELYDYQSLVTTVYILITMSEWEDA